MSRYIVLVLMAAIAVVVMFWPHSDRDDSIPDTTTLVNEQAPADGARVAAVEIPNESADIKTTDTELYEEGALISESGDFVVKQVHAVNCRIITRKVITDAGESFRNEQRCDRIESYNHPYNDLSEAQLQPLAETDGAAAFILAERLDRRLPQGSETVDRLYVHALALSGEEQAFIALFDHMTGGAGIVGTQDGIDVDHVADSFIWASIGERLGYDTGEEAARYGRALIDAGLDIEALSTEVSQWAAVITNRRQTTTGESF